MKTKNIYQGIALLAMALTTAACQNELNEDTTQPQPGEKVNMTIRATQGTTPQTRTSYEDKLGIDKKGNIVVKWEGGSDANAPVEKIKVFGYANGASEFTDCGMLSSTPSTLNADGTSITFTGTATQAENHIAIYPVDNCILEEEDGSLTFDFLNQTQDCDAGKEMEHLKKYDIMKGVPTTGTNNYTFTHQAIMLRFDLTLPIGKTEKINNVTLATSIHNGISVGMSMMTMGDNLPWTEEGTDGNSISLAINNHSGSNNLKAYMMIPSIDLTEAATLTITVATASGNNYEGKLTTDAGTELKPEFCYTLTPELALTKTINVPVAEGKLEDALKNFTPASEQTELVLTGAVGDNDITALASFLKDSKSENITTLDLSGLTNTEVKGLGACTKVTTVILPASAESIADEAFLDCTSLINIRQDEQASTTRASVSSKMKTVGARAFKGCTSMAEMFLHANITTIGANAFKILLPTITDATEAADYKKALGKPTSYDFAAYKDATPTEKVNPTKYKATVSDDSGVTDFEPGGTLGQ